MRILLVHNFYKYSGGEDQVFDNEKDLLQKNGHQVFTFTKHNEVELKNLRSKIKLLFSTHYNKNILGELRLAINEIRPEIIHVHNFFPLISPSIFYLCKQLNVPVVMTLHNYRLIYPNGLLFHNGKLDLRAITGNVWYTIIRRVYRKSLLGTFVVSNMIEWNKKKETWNKCVDAFICLTEFSRNIFRKFGIEEGRLYVKPNFTSIDKSTEGINEQNGNYYLFIGRLTEEKGILDLVKTWIDYNVKYELQIIGDGDLSEVIINKIDQQSNIKFLGKQDHNQVLKKLRSCKALIFPSIWYEGFPMTIVEAFSVGKPVITSNIGNQSFIVKNGFNGLHYDLNNSESLVVALDILNDEHIYQRLCKNAFEDFMENYTEEKNYLILMSIYTSIINKAS
ncbi:MAG: glycosyltransferase family 4 protein [Cyclobacteriaceae bacterium]